MCEPCGPVGVARAPSVVDAHAHRLVALGVALDGDGEARAAPRRARGGALQRRAAPGAAKSTKVTKAETGLPGRPNTSALGARTPNHVGLPGRSATRQKSSSHAERRERGLDVVVRADRHAAGDEHDVGLVERAAQRGHGRARGRRPRAARRRPRRRPRAASAASVERVGVVDLARAPAARPASTSSSPVARTATRGRRAQRTRRGRRRRRRRARPGRAACPAAARTSPARRSSPAPRTLSPAARRVADDDERRRSRSTSSTGTTASAPVGQRRAGGDPDRLAVAERARRGRARRATRPRSRARGPPAPRAHREAVHRAVGERRDVVGGGDVLGQHAAERGRRAGRPRPPAGGPRRARRRVPRRSRASAAFCGKCRRGASGRAGTNGRRWLDPTAIDGLRAQSPTRPSAASPTARSWRRRGWSRWSRRRR